MARRNFLVDGVSGSGKSTVFDELKRRSIHAVSTDRDWSAHLDPTTALPASPSDDTWCWQPDTALSALEDQDAHTLWVCGGARNRDHFLPHFELVFHLELDESTLRARLNQRVAPHHEELAPASQRNWTPMTASEVRATLALHQRGDRPTGAIDVDATLPVGDLVDLLLHLSEEASGGY